MTEPLDTSLRATLAHHAEQVTVDPVAGEAAIGDRLRAGDAGLSQVMAIPEGRRRPLLVAAAVLLVVALGAAAAVLGGDRDTVDTGPLDTSPGPAGAAELEFRPVLAAGPCADLGAAALPARDGTQCFQLGDGFSGLDLLETAGRMTSFSSTGSCIGSGCPAVDPSTTTIAVEEYGVMITLTEDGLEQLNALAAECHERAPLCPSGQLAIVVDDVVVSSPAVEQSAYTERQIEITGDFTAEEAQALADALQPGEPTDDGDPVTTTTPPDYDDPSIGDSGGSAKDVAERVALLVLGEEYVTADVQDSGDDDTVTLVQLEGPRGDAVIAEVHFDANLGRYRLLTITSPAFDALAAQGTRLQDGLLTLDLPEAGTVTVTGFDEHLEVAGGTPSTPAQRGTLIADVADFMPRSSWVWINLVTSDGATLHLFAPA